MSHFTAVVVAYAWIMLPLAVLHGLLFLFAIVDAAATWKRHNTRVAGQAGGHDDRLA